MHTSISKQETVCKHQYQSHEIRFINVNAKLMQCILLLISFILFFILSDVSHIEARTPLCLRLNGARTPTINFLTFVSALGPVLHQSGVCSRNIIIKLTTLWPVLHMLGP